MPRLDFVSIYNLFAAAAAAGCSFLTVCTDIHQIVYHQNEWNFFRLIALRWVSKAQCRRIYITGQFAAYFGRRHDKILKRVSSI